MHHRGGTRSRRTASARRCEFKFSGCNLVEHSAFTVEHICWKNGQLQSGKVSVSGEASWHWQSRFSAWGVVVAVFPGLKRFGWETGARLPSPHHEPRYCSKPTLSQAWLHLARMFNLRCLSTILRGDGRRRVDRVDNRKAEA